MNKLAKRLVIAGMIFILALIICANSCMSVGPTERGIVVTMGSPSNEILEPGIHFKAPFFQSIKTYDLTPVEYEKSFSVGNDGAISRDLQTVG